MITTVFEYEPIGIDSADFIENPIYKDINKTRIYARPKVVNDVFIERQQVSAFDPIHRLEFVTNLTELLTYAGGRYFNIVNNT